MVLLHLYYEASKLMRLNLEKFNPLDNFALKYVMKYGSVQCS